MAQKCYTNGKKLKILEEVDRQVAQGNSLRSVAKAVGVQPAQIRDWRCKKATIQSLPCKKKLISRGNPSTIKHLEEQVIGWALDQRADGIPLTYGILQIKAAQLDKAFRARLDHLQYNMICSLCQANKMVVHCITHQSQQNQQESIDEALEFLNIERPIVTQSCIWIHSAYI